jgi:signal transduction histidine kinase
MPGLGETFRPSLVLAFLGSGEAGAPAVAEWTPRGGPGGGDQLPGIGLGPTAGDRRVPEPPDDLAANAAAGGERRPPHALPSACCSSPRPARAPSRCALLLGWEDPLFALPAEDLNVLDGLGRQLELALSSQDRAAAVGALEAEMAQARAHLMEAERLATVGQSMAGVVHDINAPLTAVTAFAQLIQKESSDDKSRERAGHIVEAATRAQRLVRELLKMARLTPPTLELVDLRQLLQVAMDLERPQCAVSGIKLVAAFDTNVPQVKVDPHRLGQVFINLLVNAAGHGLGGEGHDVSSRPAGSSGCGDPLHRRRPRGPAGHQAEGLRLVLHHQPPGEGTGLGLAVSREILSPTAGTSGSRTRRTAARPSS